MISLDSFTYYETETLLDLVDKQIAFAYKYNDKYSHLSLGMQKVKELDELTLLRVKLTEHIKTLDEPDAMQRIKDGKRRSKV